MTNRRKTVSEAVFSLQDELRKLGATDVVISTNLKLKQDGTPYSAQRDPEDTGAAVYFKLDGRPVALAGDKWDAVADNLYAVAKHIEAMRGQERWGIGNLDRAFTGYAALPPAAGAQTWWQVLGFVSGIMPKDTASAAALINEAWRARARTAHPDAGGSHEMMSRINLARDEGLRVVGAK